MRFLGRKSGDLTQTAAQAMQTKSPEETITHFATCMRRLNAAMLEITNNQVGCHIMPYKSGANIFVFESNGDANTTYPLHIQISTVSGMGGIPVIEVQYEGSAPDGSPIPNSRTPRPNLMGNSFDPNGFHLLFGAVKGIILEHFSPEDKAAIDALIQKSDEKDALKQTSNVVQLPQSGTEPN